MNIIAPSPVTETTDTVTFSREAWNAHLDQLEEVADRAAVERSIIERARRGEAEFVRLSYTADEMDRLLEGVSPVTIWRERAGLTQRQTAALAATTPSYVSEIEAGKKPGSASVLLRLARALNVPMDYLIVSAPP